MQLVDHLPGEFLCRFPSPFGKALSLLPEVCLNSIDLPLESHKPLLRSLEPLQVMRCLFPVFQDFANAGPIFFLETADGVETTFNDLQTFRIKIKPFSVVPEGKCYLLQQGLTLLCHSFEGGEACINSPCLAETRAKPGEAGKDPPIIPLYTCISLLYREQELFVMSQDGAFRL